MASTNLSKCNLLGAMDAEVTKQLIDNDKTSHKFYIASDFKEAIRQKGALKLYNDLFQSYLLSMQKVDIRAEYVNYPSDLSDSFAVYVPNEAEGPLPKGFIIDG